jgi:2,3-bisphosphoglycerate-dependent phosphoglycerate mutase
MLSKPARHATLILLRHGKSEKHGCIVGWQDPALAERAKLEAQAAGKKIEAAGLVINVAFTFVMTRAEQTCNAALEAAGRGDAPKTAA